jgi:hypothetical protein
MAFYLPIQNYLKPKSTPANWVRPVDWITITDSANEVQFLVADTDLATFTIETTFTKNSGTNLYIDWGDGVTNTISTATSIFTNHTYAIGTGTPCSRGYTTFKIRVYADATSVITICNHVAPRAASVSGSVAYVLGLLEAYYGNNVCTALAPIFTSIPIAAISSFPGVSTFHYLEYVKLPTTVTYGNMQVIFQNCIRLFVIVMPTSGANFTNFQLCFHNCINLLDITFPSNATGITSLNTTFLNCLSLRTVSLPAALNSCTIMTQCFGSCISLKNITIPSINLCIDLISIFSGCAGLLWVKFNALPSFASPTSVNAASIFLNCVSLENVYFPSTCSVNARYILNSAFQSCSNLKSLIFPTNFDVTNLTSSFASCIGISQIIFQNGFSNCSGLTSSFSNCINLDTLTLPSTMTSGTVDMSNTFFGCRSLTTITIPSAYNIGSLSSTFNLCTNILTITLPNNSQNNITNMSNTFSSCFNLTTITMPTSLNNVNTLASAFSDCNKLQSITFPATMNIVLSIANAFLRCNSLTSVTMPTSISNCSNFDSAFSGCYKLTSITLPATVSASTTAFNNVFSTCASLKTITLPTTQTTSLTSINGTFFQCGSLTTINNLNKLGSLTATPLVAADTLTFNNLVTTLQFNCPLSKLTVNGQSATNFNLLNSLRLLNTSAGQWTGTSPQINVSFTNMSTAALVQLFNDMAAQGNVVSKTINITSATGAAGLTLANRQIITTKGWTITG